MICCEGNLEPRGWLKGAAVPTRVAEVQRDATYYEFQHYIALLSLLKQMVLNKMQVSSDCR